MLPRLLLRCPGSITQHEPILHSEAAVTPLEHKCGMAWHSAFSGPSLIQVQLLSLFPLPPQIHCNLLQLHYSLLQLLYSLIPSYTTASVSYITALSPVTL